MDCDGEPNTRPISHAAALALIPAAEALGTGLLLDLDDSFTLDGDGDCGGPPAPKPLPLRAAVELVDWLDAGLRIDAALRDCDDTPTIDADVLGYLDEIREAVALSTQPRRCTLCSCEIPAHARRLVWSWANDNDENLVLHAHQGCDAIRREIDLGEWSQGDLVDRLVQWHEDDRLNRDLGELDAGLTPEERDDMGGEIIAAALRAIADDDDDDDGERHRSDRNPQDPDRGL